MQNLLKDENARELDPEVGSAEREPVEGHTVVAEPVERRVELPQGPPLNENPVLQEMEPPEGPPPNVQPAVLEPELPQEPPPNGDPVLAESPAGVTLRRSTRVTRPPQRYDPNEWVVGQQSAIPNVGLDQVKAVMELQHKMLYDMLSFLKPN